MSTPDSGTRSRDEIIADILEAVGAKSDCDNVATMVRLMEAIGDSPPGAGFQKDNLEYAAKLREWICAGIGDDEVQLGGLICVSPGAFGWLLLWGPEDIAALDPEELLSPDYLSLATASLGMERLNSLRLVLMDLRRRCDRLIELRIGKHKNFGYRQQRAAVFSRHLMERYKLPLAYTSRTSPYRVVASLLYEAMTGEYGRDLERACENVARQPSVGTENL